MTSLVSGAYYVYGMIYDALGAGSAYAPGAVVIPHTPQAGSIIILSEKNKLNTSVGKRAEFAVRLGRAPLANVVLPLSSTQPQVGVVSPNSLTFTPQNWNVNQRVLVTGTNNCLPKADSLYQILVGKALSLDPDYIGLSGSSVPITAQCSEEGTTDAPNLRIGNYTVISERQINRDTWEYTLRAELSNIGRDVADVTASLSKMELNVEIRDGDLHFGAVAMAETSKSADTIVIRSRTRIPDIQFRLNAGVSWEMHVR